MLDKINYIVSKIDGDYAYLSNVSVPDEEDKCVARALLPLDINEGSRLVYEMMQYKLL